MLEATWLIPALPLAGVLLLLAFGRRFGEPYAGWVATGAMAGSFLTALVVLLGLLERPGDDRQFVQTLYTWVPAGGFSVDVGFLVDPLSMTMVLFITGVGSLIHLYSIGYMHGDERFHQFFLYLNAFAASMLVLVLGDNLLLTFLGWEGVGACSYLLISFWFTRESAAVAGKKAFVTNRIGDWGFMVAMFLAFVSLGTLTYTEIFEGAEQLAEATAAGIALLLFVGAAGKSAQLPLYVWLPDAMEGPTPVSALIHAATMVTSGVYLMARINPVLAQAEWVLTVIAAVGVATALFAALAAVAQRDIKKVLAYSTVSQLGFMFLAVGVGAYVAAIFHMVTHAFFKALLFLGAGSVMHGLHDEQDMARMGGVRRYMPVTAGVFIIGWLAIAGVPPFSGFWSKDEILINALEVNPVLFVLALVAALLTAYYMTRQVLLVFFGEERWREPAELVSAQPDPAAGAQADAEVEPGSEPERTPAADELATVGGHRADPHDEPHESPAIMLVPLVVLAVLATVGGALNLPFAKDLHFLEHFLEPVFGENLHHLEAGGLLKLVVAGIAVAVAAAGIAAACAVYLKERVAPERVEPELLRRAWYVDEGLAAFFGGPGRAGATVLAERVDAQGIDGAVNGVGALIRAGGSRLRHVQTGFVRTYALGIAAGAVLLLGWFLLRAGL